MTIYRKTLERFVRRPGWVKYSEWVISFLVTYSDCQINRHREVFCKKWRTLSNIKMTAQLECGSHLPSESECEGDYRTGYRNVSHCQEKQPHSGLHSPGQSYSIYLWNDTWVQTFHRDYVLFLGQRGQKPYPVQRHIPIWAI